MANARWVVKVGHESPNEQLSVGMRNDIRECVVIIPSLTQKSEIIFFWTCQQSVKAKKVLQ
jgi:hypothetical protein